MFLISINILSVRHLCRSLAIILLKFVFVNLKIFETPHMVKISRLLIIPSHYGKFSAFVHLAPALPEKETVMEEKHLALISVSDKTGIVDFARELMKIPGWEILSTGGTAVKLREGGIAVTEVAEYTGHRECLNGRIKTLNPKLFAGILAMGTPEHEATLAELGYRRIDLVVVNLYPFEETINKPGVTPEEAIEQIDIGGPSMIRAAAKNHEQVVVVVNPHDYLWVLELYRSGQPFSLENRRALAQTVFKMTAQYDTMINEYFLQITAS